MPRKKLTAIGVERVKPATARIEIWDTDLTGFGLRVTPAGKKTWCVMYRIRGQQKRFKIGHYPACDLKKARKLAGKALQLVDEGLDPAFHLHPDPVAGIPTFRVLSDDYIERHAKRHKLSWRDDERKFDIPELKSWMHRPADTITRRDVIAAIDSVVNRGKPVMANRLRALLSKLFAWAVEKAILETTPVTNIKAEPERSRERVLTDDEVKDLWMAWETQAYPFGPCFKLLLVLGQRRGEVQNMRWREVDLEKGLWSIPNTKSDNPHQCPLPERAIELLNALPRFETEDEDADYVFSTRDGAIPINGFSKAKALTDKLSKVTDWRLHDLRRTATTGLAELQVAPHVIEHVLNHATGETRRGVAGIYNRFHYLPEKREALERWAQKLTDILGDRKSADVVNIVSR